MISALNVFVSGMAFAASFDAAVQCRWVAMGLLLALSLANALLAYVNAR